MYWFEGIEGGIVLKCLDKFGYRETRLIGNKFVIVSSTHTNRRGE